MILEGSCVFPVGSPAARTGMDGLEYFHSRLGLVFVWSVWSGGVVGAGVSTLPIRDLGLVAVEGVVLHGSLERSSSDMRRLWSNVHSLGGKCVARVRCRVALQLLRGSWVWLWNSSRMKRPEGLKGIG